MKTSKQFLIRSDKEIKISDLLQNDMFECVRAIAKKEKKFIY